MAGTAADRLAAFTAFMADVATADRGNSTWIDPASKQLTGAAVDHLAALVPTLRDPALAAELPASDLAALRRHLGALLEEHQEVDLDLTTVGPP